MADLVTKMAEQRPVRLPESDASCFALNIVSFGKVQCDEASQVAGHDRSIPRIFGKYIKTEPGGISTQEGSRAGTGHISGAASPPQPDSTTAGSSTSQGLGLYGSERTNSNIDFALQPPNCS